MSTKQPAHPTHNSHAQLVAALLAALPSLAADSEHWEDGHPEGYENATKIYNQARAALKAAGIDT